MSVHALLIDDDRQLAALLAEYLEPHGVRLRHAEDGARGLALLAQGGVDIVILDVMMPGLDGLEVLRRLRARAATPVLMLTARGDETDRVVGLELGADDYLSKPVYPRELLARLRAILRRAAPTGPRRVLVIGDLEVDLDGRLARVGAVEPTLTAVEFDLLAALAERAGRVVPREQLLEAAGRGDVAVGERAIDVHISRLRAKLNGEGPPRRRIETVRGSGYRLLKEPE